MINFRVARIKSNLALNLLRTSCDTKVDHLQQCAVVGGTKAINFRVSRRKDKQPPFSGFQPILFPVPSVWCVVPIPSLCILRGLFIIYCNKMLVKVCYGDVKTFKTMKFEDNVTVQVCLIGVPMWCANIMKGSHCYFYNQDSSISQQRYQTICYVLC